MSDETKCKHCGQKLPREKLPTVRKWALVKWVAPKPQKQATRFALDIEGTLVPVYSFDQSLPDLREGQRIEVTLRPDSYGSVEVLEYHVDAPAPALAEATS